MEANNFTDQRSFPRRFCPTAKQSCNGYFCREQQMSRARRVLDSMPRKALELLYGEDQHATIRAGRQVLTHIIESCYTRAGIRMLVDNLKVASFCLSCRNQLHRY